MIRLLGIFLVAATLAAQSPVLLVLQKGASSLGFYSMDGKPLATIPVGKHPHEMVYSPDGRYLYCTDNGTMRIEQAGTGGNSISMIDLEARKRVAQISLGEFRRPHGIDIDPVTGNVLVSTELPDKLLIVDPTQRKVVRTYDTKGETSHIVRLSRDRKTAFVSNARSANVAAIDLDSGAAKLITVAERPEGSVLTRDGRYLYVVSRVGNRLSVIGTQKLEKLKEFPTGAGPVRIALTPDEKYAVYGLLGGQAVEWIDTATGQIAGHVKLDTEGAEIVSLNLSPDGGTAYAAAQDSDLVFGVSLATKSVVKRIKLPAGSGPDPVFERR